MDNELVLLSNRSTCLPVIWICGVVYAVANKGKIVQGIQILHIKIEFEDFLRMKSDFLFFQSHSYSSTFKACTNPVNCVSFLSAVKWTN